MKIALYGVSRAGKNYLIEKLVDKIKLEYGNKIYHLQGSQTLNEISDKYYKLPFKQLDEEKKQVLRKEFTKIIAKKEKEYVNVIVDGHYCFPKGNGFDVVFTAEDKAAYDVFVYIDMPSGKIVEFSKNSDGEKKNLTIIEKEVDEWKKVEVASLKKVCYDLKKELIIVDDNTQSSIEFMEQVLFINDNIYMNAERIAEAIISEHIKIISENKKIIVLDCDRTISNNDLTYDFCEKLGIGKSVLKKNFYGDRYSLYQFYNMAQLYSQYDKDKLQAAATFAISKASINKSLLDDIKANCKNYLTIGITSGIQLAWTRLAKQQAFPEIVIGCDNFERCRTIISSQVKFEFVRQLKKLGKEVIAIGDSLIDVLMLEEADKGFVVAQEKQSAGMIDYFNKNKTKIKQLSYSKFKYEGLLTKGSVSDE